MHIGIIAAAALVVIGIAILLFVCCKRRQKHAEPSISNSVCKTSSPLHDSAYEGLIANKIPTYQPLNSLKTSNDKHVYEYFDRPKVSI